MQVTDEALLLTKRKFLENGFIITAFTRAHGVYSGLLARGTKGTNTLQPGSLINMSWTARLNDQLGTIKAEPVKAYSSAFLNKKKYLLAVSTMLELLSFSLPPQHPYRDLYKMTLGFLDNLAAGKFKWHEYFSLEMSLLAASGYGLDFSSCPISKTSEDLVYVSPKSGQAISAEAGKDYDTKLLKLPKFLLDKSEPKSDTEIQEAGSLIGYFLVRYIYKTKPLPQTRNMLMKSIDNNVTSSARGAM